MYIQVNDFIGVRLISVPVIDDVIRATYDSMNKIKKDYQTQGEIPLIMIGAFRAASMFYRLKTPFEITDESHEVYCTPGIAKKGGPWKHEFKGPELVAQLAHPGECQICHYDNNEVSYHPDEKAESWNIVFGNYAVLLPKDTSKPMKTREYPLHFIIGEKNCKTQMEMWNIDDLGKKTNLFNEVVGHVDGLL